MSPSLYRLPKVESHKRKQQTVCRVTFRLSMHELPKVRSKRNVLLFRIYTDLDAQCSQEYVQLYMLQPKSRLIARAYHIYVSLVNRTTNNAANKVQHCCKTLFVDANP